MTHADRPSACELLEAVRTALLQDLLTDLPERRRYLALMMANAIAIALRELDQGPEAERAHAALLAAFYGEGEGAQSAELLTRRLCREIRQGRFKGGPLEALLRAQLKRSAAARAAISNPKALKEG